MLERKRLKRDRLFLYTQKTGTPVYVPLPPELVAALNFCPIETLNTSSGLENLNRQLPLAIRENTSTDSSKLREFAEENLIDSVIPS